MITKALFATVVTFTALLTMGCNECQFLTDCPTGEACYDGVCEPQPDFLNPNNPNNNGALSAAIEIDSVNDREPIGETVAPLDDVIFSGANSTANGSISSYRWAIVSKPAESTVEFGTPTGAQTGFVFSSANGIVDGVDVAGSFIINLEVTDDAGNSASTTFSFESVPADPIHVQLTWDTDSGDVDLHFSRTEDSAICSDDTCYYSNCGDAGVPWGAKLDIDDVNGFGPENINMAQPADSDYVVTVMAFDIFTPTTARIRIFEFGEPVYEGEQLLTEVGDVWRVAKLDWAQDAMSVQPFETFHPEAGCGFSGGL